VNDAGFAVHARAFNDVVVEGVGLFLGDQGSIQGNTTLHRKAMEVNRKENRYLQKCFIQGNTETRESGAM